MKCAWTLVLIAMAIGSTALLAAPAQNDEGETETAAATVSGILHKKIVVSAINDDWTRTGMVVEPKDMVVILAQGNARVRPWGDEVGPEGLETGAGKLEGKVGSAQPYWVGKSTAFIATERGIVKFRIHDSRYDDNLGGFSVDVLVFAPKAIPRADDVPAEKQ